MVSHQWYYSYLQSRPRAFLRPHRETRARIGANASQLALSRSGARESAALPSFKNGRCGGS